MPKLLLVGLLEVEAAVVQGLVIVLLENLGEERLHVLLHLTPLPVFLLQAGQHHRDCHTWVLLQQVNDVVTRVSACTTDIDVTSLLHQTDSQLIKRVTD